MRKGIAWVTDDLCSVWNRWDGEERNVRHHPCSVLAIQELCLWKLCGLFGLPEVAAMTFLFKALCCLILSISLHCPEDCNALVTSEHTCSCSPFSPVVLKAEIQSYHSVEIADRWGCSVWGVWWWKETFEAANQASVQISTQTNILCLQTWDWKSGLGFSSLYFRYYLKTLLLRTRR